MGSSCFAIPVLRTLLWSDHDVVAVFTKKPNVTSRQNKRQKTERRSAIYDMAEVNGVEIICPDKFSTSPESIDRLYALEPDFIIVASYGLILTRKVIDAAKFCCMNVHPSDLPRWRGAAPIQRSIMAGDNHTAVCIMKMDTGIDTGDVILRQEIAIDDCVNEEMLSQRLSAIGGEMVLEILNSMSTSNGNKTNNDKISCKKQSTYGITYANKISSEDEIVCWDINGAKMIHRQIAGLPRHSPAKLNLDCFCNINVNVFSSTYISNEDVAKILSEDLTERHDIVLRYHNLLTKESVPADVIKSFLASSTLMNHIFFEKISVYGKHLRNKPEDHSLINDIASAYPIWIKCCDGGVLIPLLLQRPGGKILPVSEFFRGFCSKKKSC